MGRRALPASRRGSGRRAGARDRAAPRARRRARGARCGPQRAVDRVEGAVRAPARARACPVREAAAPRLRHRAPPPSGGRARRHAHRADRRCAEGRERQRPRRGGGRGRGGRRPRAGARGRGGERARGRRRDRADRGRSGRDPPVPLPPSNRLRQDDRRIRLRRGCANRGRPDPHPPASARRPVPPRADRARLRLALPRGGTHRSHRSAAVEPDHDPDLCMVRTARRRDRSRRVRARHLRRGAHGARREDVDRDPFSQRADLHRHDRDGGADRQAGVGRVPRLGRRPAARRCCAPRPDRAAALPARPAGRGDQPGADRRRRLRGARPRAGARPRGAEHGRRDAVPRAVRRHAGNRVRRRRRSRIQPRHGVPRCGHQGGGGLRADAAGQARRDPGRLRACRDRRADQRNAARRRLELAARDDRHASRTDGVEARLPAADRAHHAHPSAQGSRHRRRLHSKGGDAQRARRVAALAARRGLLPRRRTRDAGTAPPHPAAGEAEADAGVVARSRHARRPAAQDGDRARVAARRSEVPRRGRAGVLGRDRRPPAALRRARRVRREADCARRIEARDGEVPVDVRSAEPQPAAAADRAGGPRVDEGRTRRLRRSRHARHAGSSVGEGSRGGCPHDAAGDRRGQGGRAGSDPRPLDVEALTRSPQATRPQGVSGVSGCEAPARRTGELARAPARGERGEARERRARDAARGRRSSAGLGRGLHAALDAAARGRARAARDDPGGRGLDRGEPAPAEDRPVARTAPSPAQEEDGHRGHRRRDSGRPGRPARRRRSRGPACAGQEAAAQAQEAGGGRDRAPRPRPRTAPRRPRPNRPCPPKTRPNEPCPGSDPRTRLDQTRPGSDPRTRRSETRPGSDPARARSAKVAFWPWSRLGGTRPGSDPSHGATRHGRNRSRRRNESPANWVDNGC